ncbi:MAG: PRC-barrel protein [Acidobacteriales bacterium]|nr:PRC-barrel protein [Terriglobales bacterium]
MAIYSNLRDYKFGESGEDIRGSKVYGSDGEKLGEIDDVIFDNKAGDVRYVVVDTGGWLTSKKFVVPARQIMTREVDDDFRVNLTKEQVQKLPQYRESDVESDEQWSDYESRYEASWSDSPVMHREGSTHTITPDATEMPAQSGSSATPQDVRKATPRRIAKDQPRFGATSDSNSGTSTGNLVGNTELEPVMNEYTGVDAVIPAQSGEEPSANPRTDYQNQGTSSTQKERTGIPAETDKMDSGRAPVTSGNRFREFEERLRRERDEILRRRKAA